MRRFHNRVNLLKVLLLVSGMIGVSGEVSRFVRVLKDKRLAGNVYFKRNVEERHCLYECSAMSEKCGSVNYHPQDRICEINKRLQHAITEDDIMLETSDGWKFFEKTKDEKEVN